MSIRGYDPTKQRDADCRVADSHIDLIAQVFYKNLVNTPWSSAGYGEDQFNSRYVGERNRYRHATERALTEYEKLKGLAKVTDGL